MSLPACWRLIQMLTLSGAAGLESPVMGAITDLDPNNAYTIMSYMSIKVGMSCECIENPLRQCSR